MSFPPPPDDVAIGMGAYLSSDLAGTGGRLKVRAEDFVVEEVPLAFPPPQADGKYTVAAVRAKNWETNRLVREIADRLGVSKKGVFFAGTKDKRAVTTQYLSVRAPLDRVVSLGIKDVEILDAFRVDRAPKIGELVGNRFVIRARQFAVPAVEAEARARAILGVLEGAGGFPNYFGVQRFGTVRSLTHVMGDLVCHGRWEDAFWTYVANPLPGEPAEIHAVRARLHASRDLKAALREYPNHLSFERQMIHHVVEHPGDFVGAIRALPLNLGMMFVYARQSLLFNHVLAERLRRGLALNDPLEGDLVVGLTPSGTPDRTRFIPVSARNREKVARQCGRGRAFVTGVILGTDVPLATGVPGEIEAATIEKLGFTRDEFLVEAYAEVSSTGTRRELLAPLAGVGLDRGADEAGEFLEYRFFLGKGSYATSLLREVMKTPGTSLA